MVTTRRETAVEADPALEGARVVIVEGRYYEALADELLAGARAVLEAAGVAVEVITVPGALEIPVAAEIAIAASEEGGEPVDAVVGLGVVIRGETYHFDIVANESSRALMDLAVSESLPIGNGIMTVENEEQAWARVKRSEKDKGGFAARAALSMIELKKKLGG